MKKYLTASRRWFHPIINWLRRRRDGAGCCDVFGADYYMAKKILPVLKTFRKQNNVSHPCDLDSIEDWHKEVDEMIWAFQWLIDGEDYEDYKKDGEVMYERQQKGFELFGKRFRQLWI